MSHKEEDEAVEEGKEMRSVVPPTEGTEVDSVTQSLGQKTKLTEQEKDQFWNQFYQEFMLYKQERKQYENSCFEQAVIEEQNGDEEINAVERKTTSTPGDKTFLNHHICMLFFSVMSLNILWMQLLLQRFGNNPVIQLVQWMMIIATLGTSASVSYDAYRNGEYEVKVVNGAGRDSAIQTIEITGIDDTLPSFDLETTDGFTFGDFWYQPLTIRVLSDAEEIYYSTSGKDGPWQKYEDKIYINETSAYFLQGEEQRQGIYLSAI